MLAKGLGVVDAHDRHDQGHVSGGALALELLLGGKGCLAVPGRHGPALADVAGDQRRVVAQALERADVLAV